MISLTATHILEYLYCPRFSYFENVLDIPEHQENRFKVQKGRDVHERVRKTNPNYLRKKIGVVDKQSDVYLSSPSGIRGIVDEILFLDDGTAAPLDYKFAEYKEKLFKTYRMQLVFYGRLIQDNFNVPVNRGFIVYTRSRNKLVEVSLADTDFKELDKTIEGLWNVIGRCRYPQPTRYKRRCPDCCYRNICERNI
ncbi:CRISPR-associated protein Cas4 [Desulfosarcina ovata subsp. sediminis]|uniref:CRISPR-associated exonuclease Cas4 n=1 Tax=Desulfosarcina ovata subsp. sediminis TaxID=885957 RepID=A0A5K7ZQ22_9BACT|nr:CRISPR-associated protein Cas4 [Desulfosarcina ovata]BBO82129.1 CRISPR-associated protein Cas4 [Desulfosarcina ovata subsp. sediminis]